MSAEIKNEILGDMQTMMQRARETNPWPDYIDRIKRCTRWISELSDDDELMSVTKNGGRRSGSLMMEICPGLYDSRPQGTPRTCCVCGSHHGVHMSTDMSGIAAYVCMDCDTPDLSIA